MKFIMSEDGTEAVNIAFVRRLSIERRIYTEGTTEVCVVAEMNDDGEEEVDLK